MSEVRLAGMMNEGPTLGWGSLTFWKRGFESRPEGKYLFCWFPSEHETRRTVDLALGLLGTAPNHENESIHAEFVRVEFMTAPKLQ